MNILVCVKAVPNPVLPLEFDVEHDTIRDTGWNYILNPYDEVALEEALRCKDEHGGTVTAMTLGTEKDDDILRKCIAMGADEAVRIDIPHSFQPDGYTTASILAEAIRCHNYDVILCGYKSADRNAGEVGCMLAEFLGLPVVTAVVELQIDPRTGTITVSRRMERGAREIKRCRLPALLTVDMMLNEPRYPTLTGRNAAARHTIRVINDVTHPGIRDLMEAGVQLTRTVSISKPPPKKIFIPTGNLTPAERIRMLTQGSTVKKSSSNILEGNPGDIAEKVVAFLKEKRFVN